MVNKLRNTQQLLQVTIALIIACAFLFSEAPVMGQHQAVRKNEIHFTDQRLEKAFQQAKKKQQLVFVDAYAAWCGPCKDLKSQTFTDRGVATYFNTNFVNISLDMEKGEGLKFANQYGVDSYPTLLFIDSDGYLVEKSEGFLDPAALIALAKATNLKKRL